MAQNTVLSLVQTLRQLLHNKLRSGLFLSHEYQEKLSVLKIHVRVSQIHFNQILLHKQGMRTNLIFQNQVETLALNL